MPFYFMVRVSNGMLMLSSPCAHMLLGVSGTSYNMLGANCTLGIIINLYWLPRWLQIRHSIYFSSLSWYPVASTVIARDAQMPPGSTSGKPTHTGHPLHLSLSLSLSIPSSPSSTVFSMSGALNVYMHRACCGIHIRLSTSGVRDTSVRCVWC